ncbi:MAG TPA: c-type cytochrome [Caulobacteraceae bacterium]|jgi:cytochrome c553|nr:c-type cytochrome [Caulobacteraceae bacterium]
MKKFSNALATAGCAAAVASVFAVEGGLAAQKAPRQQPEWAYAIPPNGDATAAVIPDDGTVYSLPGSEGKFTYTQVRGTPAPADWFPGDHPPMPKIVAEGDPKRNIMACSLCHYPNGKGRTENAPVSGLPKDYIVEQLHDMKTGARHSAEPLKANAALMVAMAKAMTEDEINASAAYFSAIPWTPWIRVVESATAPKVDNEAGLLLPVEGAKAGSEPIAGRIVEVPVNRKNTEMLRDPHSGFTAYVPPGAVARGKMLVTTGASGKTLACATCHGPDLNGVGAIPGLAGRSPSYIARQLNDFRQGARNGAMSALMKPVTANLTTRDITDIAAYLASRPVPAPTRQAVGKGSGNTSLKR